MNTPLLVPVFVASLLGSLHCAGMCGGFVGFYSGSDARGRVLWSGHVAYNLGRLVTYATLGAVAGAAGAAVDLAGSWAGVGKVAAVVAGLLMIGWGIVVALDNLGVVLPRPRLPRSIARQSVRLLSRIRAYPALARAVLLGLSTTALPCGWLYAFVLSAAGTSSAVDGALVMVAFWSGSVPMLLGLGVLLQRATRRLRTHLPLLSAFALILVGMANLLSRNNIPAVALQSVSAAFATDSEGATGLVQGNLPPCHTKSP